MFNVPKEEVLANFDFFYRPPAWKEFLSLPKDDLHRIEFIDGRIVRFTPSVSHQRILGLLFMKFQQCLSPSDSCEVFFAPLDVRLGSNVVQPDLMVICDEIGEDVYEGVPTIVLEVLSQSTKHMDLGRKLELYREGGIKEYWIVDPRWKSVQIYTFDEEESFWEYFDKEEAASKIFKQLLVRLDVFFDYFANSEK